MTLATALATFAASFALVAVKAYQQLNVMHHRLLAVWPTGLAFALAEFYVVGVIARGNWANVIPLWLGGALGCTLSMVLHKRWRDRDSMNKRDMMNEIENLLGADALLKARSQARKHETLRSEWDDVARAMGNSSASHLRLVSKDALARVLGDLHGADLVRVVPRFGDVSLRYVCRACGDWLGSVRTAICPHNCPLADEPTSDRVAAALAAADAILDAVAKVD